MDTDNLQPVTSQLATQILANLDPDNIFRQIHYHAPTESTNSDLAQLAREGAASGTVVISDWQTAGRGRFQRSWIQKPGKGLAISLLLTASDFTPSFLTWLPLVTGLGVRQALENQLHSSQKENQQPGNGKSSKSLPPNRKQLQVGLKWPNDILLIDKCKKKSNSSPAWHEGKISGILTQQIVCENTTAVIVGIGINTKLAQEELPLPQATSLALAGMTNIDHAILAAEILNQCGSEYRLLAQGQHPQQRYQNHCDTIGKKVRAQLDGQRLAGENLCGIAAGISVAGELILRLDSGEIRAVSAADIFHLR